MFYFAGIFVTFLEIFIHNSNQKIVNIIMCLLCSRYFVNILSIHNCGAFSQQSYEECVIILILQIMKLRLKELQILAQDPTLEVQLEFEPRTILTPRIILFTIVLLIFLRSQEALKIPLGCGFLMHLEASNNLIGSYFVCPLCPHSPGMLW